MSLLETMLLISVVCLVVFAAVFGMVHFGSRGEKRPIVRGSTILFFAPVALLFNGLYRGDSWEVLAATAAVFVAAAAATYAAGRLFKHRVGPEDVTSDTMTRQTDTRSDRSD